MTAGDVLIIAAILFGIFRADINRHWYYGRRGLMKRIRRWRARGD